MKIVIVDEPVLLRRTTKCSKGVVPGTYSKARDAERQPSGEVGKITVVIGRLAEFQVSLDGHRE